MHRWFISTQALAAFLALRTENHPDPFAALTPSLREEARRENRAIFQALSAAITCGPAPGEAP